jgi:CO/xanthine dehydrogenase Mo-binding subunit
MAVTGQLEGGAVQGIGRALTEHYLVEDGVPRNASFTTYLLPLATDVPPIESILVTVPSEEGPFGARAVAEPPGFGAPAAIANAVEDAVGVRITDLPVSADRVLMALHGEQPNPLFDLSFLEDGAAAGKAEIRWQSGG